MNKVLILFILAVGFDFSESAKILALLHLPSYSHNAAPNALVEGLAAKGHEITVLTTTPRKPPLKNVRDINLAAFKEKAKDDSFNAFVLENAHPMVAEVFLQSMIRNVTEIFLSDEKVQQLLNSNEKFDLVMIEDFLAHSLKGFAHHFDAPCIMFSSTGLSRYIAPQVANPYNPSYVPELQSPYSRHMDFFQRLYNSAIYLFGELYKHFYVIPKHNELLQKYFPNPPNHINDIYYNVALSFVNGNVGVQQPVPYVPNMIDIGGIHVKPPKKLPKDLQEYLDSAKDGFIFFSMGSNLKSALLPLEKREAILKTFAKLKQKVIWKFEDENLPGKPSNLEIRKWLPQPDILAHPNIKLFITHGGLMSQIEAIDRGVPVLGIPIYGDQKMNLANAELKGTGLTMAYSELNEEVFLGKIQEMLINPKYRENARKFSKIMHDQPTTPLERGVFWTEYVIRHKGAHHLRTAGLNLAWYQYLLLDVTLLLVATGISTLALLYIVTKRCLTSRKTSKTSLKNKKD